MPLFTINRIVVDHPEDVPRMSRRLWRRSTAVAAVVLAAGGVTAGVTVASAKPSPQVTTTDVHFVPLNPAVSVLNNKAIALGKSLSVVVVGGKSTVPTDATTVELSVTASGTAAGIINIFPAGNSGGGSGQFLSWNAGGSDTATIEENIGTKDELTFADNTGAAKVTASITGYSTQVSDGDISPADGTAGQVLTNTGTGVQWQTPSSGLGAYGFRFTSPISIPPNSQIGGTAVCPTGSDILSGGVFATSGAPGVDVNSSYPTPDLAGWTVFMNNSTTTVKTFQVYAVCAAVTG